MFLPPLDYPLVVCLPDFSENSTLDTEIECLQNKTHLNTLLDAEGISLASNEAANQPGGVWFQCDAGIKLSYSHHTTNQPL